MNNREETFNSMERQIVEKIRRAHDPDRAVLARKALVAVQIDLD